MTHPAKPCDIWGLLTLKDGTKMPGYISSCQAFGAVMVQIDIPYPSGEVRRWHHLDAIATIDVLDEENARAIAESI